MERHVILMTSRCESPGRGFFHFYDRFFIFVCPVKVSNLHNPVAAP